jgi:hypothetical protein
MGVRSDKGRVDMAEQDMGVADGCEAVSQPTFTDDRHAATRYHSCLVPKRSEDFFCAARKKKEYC